MDVLAQVWMVARGWVEYGGNEPSQPRLMRCGDSGTNRDRHAIRAVLVLGRCVVRVGFAALTATPSSIPCVYPWSPSKPMRLNHISNGTVTSGGTAASRASVQAHQGQRRRTADTRVTIT